MLLGALIFISFTSKGKIMHIGLVAKLQPLVQSIDGRRLFPGHVKVENCRVLLYPPSVYRLGDNRTPLLDRPSQYGSGR